MSSHMFEPQTANITCVINVVPTFLKVTGHFIQYVNVPFVQVQFLIYRSRLFLT